MFIGSVFKETFRRAKMPVSSNHMDFGPFLRIEDRVLDSTFKDGNGKTFYVYKLLCTVAREHSGNDTGRRREDVLEISEEEVHQAVIHGYYTFFDTTKDVTPFSSYLQDLAQEKEWEEQHKAKKTAEADV